MTLLADRVPADAAARPGAVPWRPAADRVHAAAATAALSVTAALALASPAAAAAMAAAGGAVLLAGGALIGVPHGSSDFVVARRLLRPALHRLWLPFFLAPYLALVGAVMAGWALAPFPTLLAFLLASALHFGADDARPAADGGLLFAVRATTPVLPIFLLHPAGVAGFLAALGGVGEPTVLAALDALRLPLLPVWAAALAAATLPRLARGGDGAREARQLLAIALAAAVLPPLLSFALSFCLVHAVRHMLGIAERHAPRRPAAAAALAAAIVLPSAAACSAVLVLAWDGLAGAFSTAEVVTGALRIVAALTVPHMALDWLAARDPATLRR